MTNHPGQFCVGLSQFIGQERVKAALQSRINKAQQTGDAMPHLILSAGPDMGKLTLAKAVANARGVDFSFKNCGEISSTTDLTGIFSKIKLFDLLVLEASAT
jgi:holliday junction DNA helicase RuvB